MTIRLLPYGQDAVLVELPGPSTVVPFAEVALELPGVLEAVTGRRRCSSSSTAH